jgi:hypothetical protein
VFAMVCGVYIYSVCLKQISTYTKTKIINIQVSENPCHENAVELSEIPYIHYPKPETFSR